MTRELERTCVDAVSLDAIDQHVRWLTRETPYRIAGGGQDRKAAGYIVQTMAGYGLEAEITEFDTYNSYPAEGSLRVVAPVERAITCRASLHIEATPPGGYEAELIYVGAGGEADYTGKDVRGKVVLAEVSYAPATPEKARLAHVHGAAGLVLMNWGTPDQAFIPMRALKAVWGNPTPETWAEIPRLYAVTTTRADGELLKELCLAGPVRVRLETTSDRQWGIVPQPIAELKAPASSPEAEQFIIVSGHLDAWEPGVTDNATGNAVMLEAARVLAQHRQQLRRSVQFCFWNGHEIAEAAGSAHYVDAEWDRVSRHAVAYLNIDSPGMKLATHFVAQSSAELAAFHGPVEERVLGSRGDRQALWRAGDQSFLGVGVPSLTGRYCHTEDLVKQWNGAVLGWWNHTSEENYEKVEHALLHKEAQLWVAYILALATAPVLPQRFVPRAEDMLAKLTAATAGADESSRLGGLAAAAAGADEGLRLGGLTALASDLVGRCRWLDERADTLAARWEAGEAPEAETQALNQVLLRLSRHLTAVCATASGKYAQDHYGLSTLSAPVPMLAPLARYNELPADSLERKLLRTKLMRARNQITDALRGALGEIATFPQPYDV